MSDKQFGAGFRVVGTVKRTRIAPSGNFATISIEVPHERGQKIVEVRSFGKDGLMETIKSLTVGQKLEVTGEIGSEVLKHNGEEVMVGGYRKWVTALTARKIEATKRIAAEIKIDADPLGDDKVGW